MKMSNLLYAPTASDKNDRSWVNLTCTTEVADYLTFPDTVNRNASSAQAGVSGVCR